MSVSFISGYQKLSGKKIFLLLLCCCLVLAGITQQILHFENITEADGLSDNRITCFFKDKAGFMWIGTENGLNRYDGRSFRIYKPGYPHQHISNPFVNDIEQDGLGRLWISTYGGLNVIDLRNDSLQVFTPDDSAALQQSKRISSNLIWDTYIDEENKIWIVGDNRDLCYYDNHTHEFIYYPWKEYLKNQLQQTKPVYNSIKRLYFKSRDELWLGTTAGLFSFNKKNGQFRYHPSRATDHFTGLQATPDNSRVYFVQQPDENIQILTASGLYSNYKPETIISSNAGRYKLWLPFGKAIAGVDEITGAIGIIRHQTDDPYSLPSGTVRVVYRDNQGLIWAGTENGIGKFNPSLNLFSFATVIPAQQDSSGARNLFQTNTLIHTAFYSKTDNKYFISSPKNNCLYIQDAETGSVKLIQKIGGQPLERCSVIYEDRDKNIWVLAAHYAFRYDRLSDVFFPIALPDSGKKGFFAAMTEDGAGNLWIARYDDGLYVFNKKTGTWWKPSRRDRFSSTLPTSVYYDSLHNQLWIGTFEYGAYRYRFDTHKFENFPADAREPGRIRSSLINSITQDKKGNIWVATFNEGIARYDFSTHRFTHFTTAEGLPDNTIYSLLPDQNGNIWASGFKNLSLLNDAGSIIRNFSRSNGFPFTGLYNPFMKGSSGNIQAAAGNGFLYFHPDKINYRSSPFRIVITSFLSKDRRELLRLAAPVTEFSYANDEVHFSFAALAYDFPLQTMYQYRLKGQNNQWVNAGNANSVTYINLKPGLYTFEVKAIDFTGRLSDNTANINFRIWPPWWQNGWFRLLLLIVGSGLLIYIIRSRIKILKTRLAIRQQLAELKAQALRAQMNPHFIFNSLNAIQELIISENYSSSYEYLSKFSKLLRMVLNASEKNLISLREEIEMSQLYLELESLRFKNSFHYQLQADEQIDTDNTFFPTLLLQPFLENAIWHGLLLKEGEKNLVVKFEEKDHSLICTVEDNGIGRARSAAIKAKKIGAGHFNSKGTTLVKQRVDALNNSGIMTASVSTEDIENPAGVIAGTRVTIRIHQIKSVRHDQNHDSRR